VPPNRAGIFYAILCARGGLKRVKLMSEVAERDQTRGLVSAEAEVLDARIRA
jgi:hypothetical protein